MSAVSLHEARCSAVQRSYYRTSVRPLAPADGHDQVLAGQHPVDGGAPMF